MECFKASVHYGDWGGTAAADEANPRNGLWGYLEAQGLKGEDEFLVAASLYRGALGVGVLAYLYKAADMGSVREELVAIKGPIPVRQVRLDLTLDQFLDLFDRLKVMLTWDGLGLDRREYSIVEP
jgi:hypothetical protein